MSGLAGSVLVNKIIIAPDTGHISPQFERQLADNQGDQRLSQMILEFGNILVFFFSAFLLMESLGLSIIPGWAKSYVFIAIAGTLVMVGGSAVV